MSLEDDLATLLKTVTALSPLNFQYKTKAESSVLPKITLNDNTSKRLASNDGDVGMVTAHVQIDVVAATMNGASGAKAIARAITKKLQGFKGAAGSTQISCCLQENDWSDSEPFNAAREDQNQKVVQLWAISYSDSLS